MILILDALIFVSALIASYLWYRASVRKLRRISKDEVFDRADYNRLITAVNRTQILNSRASLATALATALATLRFVFVELPA